MFRGSLTALVTPFKNGAVDDDAFATLVERQINAGTHGLVPWGTTGESPTLTTVEKKHLISLTVELSAGRVPVIAGVGSNSTAATIEMQAFSRDAGVDAGLVVTPYYNKPSQDGLFAHFEAISDAVDLPIIVYNIPGRSIVDISNATMVRIAKLKNVIGVKDATGDIARVSAYRTSIGDDFCQLSGEDPTAIGYNAQGGVGCISVTSNVAPALCARMQIATLEGRYDEANALQAKLYELHEALFMSPSPGPAKYALSLMGLCSDELRLPLTPPDETVKARIRDALDQAGLEYVS